MKNCNFSPTVAVYLLGMISSVSYGATYYASPTGSAGGMGTLAAPWDLTTALAHPAVVRPGDTIFLRGGTYRGQYRSSLAGTAAAPIVVRPYQSERAIIDGASVNSFSSPMYGALTILGPYTWYQGFEITNSYPTRIYPRATCFEYQHCRGHGVDVFGVGTKLINLVIHDTSDAIGLWTPAIDAEVHGCIIYYIGNQTETRGHGMGIYAQNDLGTKRITNNIIFDGFHSGIHIYGSASSVLRNVIVEGNTIFQNGILATDPNGWGIIVGGNVIADTITIRNNYFYNPNWFLRSSNINPSWGLGSTRLSLTNNDSVGYRSLEYSLIPTSSTITGNRLYGYMNDLAVASVSTASNIIASTPPSTPRVYFSPNQYDTTRTHVTVFNGSGASSVQINPSSVLVSGDTFEIRSVQNYFGAPLVTGTYGGTAFSVPMGNATLTPIVGTPPRFPVATGSGFDSFILRKTGSSAPPPPPPPPPAGAAATCTINTVCRAEIGNILSPMLRLASPAGGNYVLSTVANAGTASYTFDVPYTSNLSLWLRIQALDTTRDSFFLSIDGGPEAEFLVSSGWSSSFVWAQATQRQATTGATVLWNPSLSAGRHTLTIRGREAWTALDLIALANNSSYRP